MAERVLPLRVELRGREAELGHDEDGVVAESLRSPALARDATDPRPLAHDRLIIGAGFNVHHGADITRSAPFVRNLGEFAFEQAQVVFVGRLWSGVARRVHTGAPA